MAALCATLTLTSLGTILATARSPLGGGAFVAALTFATALHIAVGYAGVMFPFFVPIPAYVTLGILLFPTSGVVGFLTPILACVISLLVLILIIVAYEGYTKKEDTTSGLSKRLVLAVHLISLYLLMRVMWGR